LISGAEGGMVFYDQYAKTLYRQHKRNLVGSNVGVRARLARLWMVFRGRFHEWNRKNIRALEVMSHRLDNRNLEILSNFKVARDQPLFKRVAGVWRSGVYRQTFGGNLGLLFATLIRKI